MNGGFDSLMERSLSLKSITGQALHQENSVQVTLFSCSLMVKICISRSINQNSALCFQVISLFKAIYLLAFFYLKLMIRSKFFKEQLLSIQRKLKTSKKTKKFWNLSRSFKMKKQLLNSTKSRWWMTLSKKNSSYKSWWLKTTIFELK